MRIALAIAVLAAVGVVLWLALRPRPKTGVDKVVDFADTIVDGTFDWVASAADDVPFCKHTPAEWCRRSDVAMQFGGILNSPACRDFYQRKRAEHGCA